MGPSFSAPVILQAINIMSVGILFYQYKVTRASGRGSQHPPVPKTTSGKKSDVWAYFSSGILRCVIAKMLSDL